VFAKLLPNGVPFLLYATRVGALRKYPARVRFPFESDVILAICIVGLPVGDPISAVHLLDAIRLVCVINTSPLTIVELALSNTTGVVTVTVAATEVPTIFVAATVNVYNVSDDNSVNAKVLVDAFVLPDKLSGDPVIVYPVIAVPPSEVGTLHETVQSIRLPELVFMLVTKAVGEEGGGAITVTVAATEVPTIFIAVTVNVYSVLTDNPVNAKVLVDAFVLSDKLSGDPVIVYPVIAVPPLEVGALQETVQSQLVLDILVILVVKSVGEEGGAGVVTVTVAGKEGPALFEAVTVNVYSVLTNNPVNVNAVIDPSVVPDKVPGDPVIVYPVIVSPPELGALQETVQSQLVLDILVILVVKSVGEEGTDSVLANNDRVRAVC
jgi:hypothetical protein